STGGGPVARAVHGAKVGVPYALLSLILSFIVPFRIPSPLSQPSVHAGISHGGAFLLPLVLGLVAGGFGGLLSRRTELEERGGWGRQALTAIVAGWRMLLFALLFSFAGLLVLAALHPTLTSSVVRGEIDSNGGYGATMVNHVLVLPNQSMW